MGTVNPLTPQVHNMPMLNLRTLAYVAAGLGFVIFLAGIAMVFLVTPDCQGNVHCEAAKYDNLEPQVLAIWILGVLLVAAGAGILLKLRLEQQNAPPSPAPFRGPPQGKARLPPLDTRFGDVRKGPLPPRPPQPPSGR